MIRNSQLRLIELEKIEQQSKQENESVGKKSTAAKQQAEQEISRAIETLTGVQQELENKGLDKKENARAVERAIVRLKQKQESQGNREKNKGEVKGNSKINRHR